MKVLLTTALQVGANKKNIDFLKKDMETGRVSGRYVTMLCFTDILIEEASCSAEAVAKVSE